MRLRGGNAAVGSGKWRLSACARPLVPHLSHVRHLPAPHARAQKENVQIDPLEISFNKRLLGLVA